MKKTIHNNLEQSLNIQKHAASISRVALKISMAAAAFSAACIPAMAALPTIAPPTQGGIGGAAVQDGDIIGTLGGYFKMGLLMMGLVIAAYAFIYLVIGGLRRWKDYANGQASFAELKEYIIAAVVLIAFVVVLIGYSASTLA